MNPKVRSFAPRVERRPDRGPVGSVASLALAAGYYRFGGWRTLRMIKDERLAAGEPPDTGLGVPRGRAGLSEAVEDE